MPYERNFKKAEVKLTDGSNWVGEVNVAEYHRITDLFIMKPSPFVAFRSDDGQVLILNKHQIIYVKVL